MVFRLAKFVPAPTTRADAVCVPRFVVDQESEGTDARWRVGECLLELTGACSAAQCRRSGDSDMDARWGGCRKGSSFVMWKPTGEVDAYGGSGWLEAAMVGIPVFVVGMLMVIERKIFCFFREEKSFLVQYCVARDVLCSPSPHLGPMGKSRFSIKTSWFNRFYG